MNFSNGESYKKISAALLAVLLFVGVLAAHFLSSISEVEHSGERTALSADFLKLVDLGLHSTFASFLWVDTRTHLPFLPEGFEAFENDFNTVTELNPRFSEPYAFTVVVLPHVRKDGVVEAAVDIGRRGVKEAKPLDWRIPFYTAATMHVYQQNYKEAAKYFDIASRAENIPNEVRRFALNYSILRDVREAAKNLWGAIYEEADDENTKQRALKHIEHIEIVQALDNAVEVYKDRFGFYPSSPQDLIGGGVIEKLPESPLGDVEWRILSDGRIGVAD